MFGVQNVSILGYINGTPPKKKAQGTSNIFFRPRNLSMLGDFTRFHGGKKIYQKLSSFFGGPTGKTGRVLQSLF
jgi:hypothetical protein